VTANVEATATIVIVNASANALIAGTKTSNGNQQRPV